jgi:outer membrane protein assembly factor BamA
VSALAQRAPTGWEVSGLPAINYNADEGFGYGVLLHLYNYGQAGKLPYRFTLQPTVFLTSNGRRDLTLFFDAPDVGGSRWRLDAYAGHETHNASPYYGIGNATIRIDSLADAKYYRFGRRRLQVTTNLQRRLGVTKLRMLFGAGAVRVRVDESPDAVPTSVSTEFRAVEPPEGWSNYVRAGLVWDSRDRETHTTRGTWADALIQRVDKALGSDWSYTRATMTVRHYRPLGGRLTWAERIVVQSVTGEAPFYDLAVVQTSFKPQEGLGGGGTLRGLPANRYVGKGLAVLNSELRWRAANFTLIGAASSLTLSGFVDAGRVWSERLQLSELVSDLHAAFGGGIRLGRGPNFVISLDAAHSAQSTLPLYIGLGFLF